MTQEDIKKPKRPQNIIMENRERLAVSGVLDVDSFDDGSVTAFTELGELTVKGNSLHIESLDTASGELVITGTVRGMVYSETREKSTGIFGRLLR